MAGLRPGGRRPAWVVGVAVDGHGSHPAAWRTLARPEPRDLLDGATALRHVRTAEAAGCTFATFDDAYGLHGTTEQDVRGRVDALLLAAKLAPLTSTIGLVPTIDVTHTEPFHVAKNVATLDWVSEGRAGWRVAVSTTEEVAALFGRRSVEPVVELRAEAADVVEVARRLWDSWEDDAIIRDAPTGRFIDRDKVHHVDFVGARFSIRGPSIVPRSPQGQPIVVVDVGGRPDAGDDVSALGLAARTADVVLIDAPHPAAAALRRDAVLAAAADAGRDRGEISVLVHVDVVLATHDAEAGRRLAELDELAPWPLPSERLRLATTPAGLTDELGRFAEAVDGVHLRPAVLHADLPPLADAVVPALPRRPPGRRAVPGTTLRDLLALDRPPSRYAAAHR